MNEDTRKKILRLQKEDLARLWTESIENDSELDATMRVYRRQSSILDRHLEKARQTGTSKDAAEAIVDETLVASHRSTNGIAPILTELRDVHQPGIAYPHCGRPSLITSTASPPPIVDATTARPLLQVTERPVVRFPHEPVHPMVRLPSIGPNVEESERTQKPLQEECEAAIQSRQDEEAHKEIERKERIGKAVEALITPFATATGRSSSVSSKSATTARTNLKRSANHLSTPDGPASKKQASAIIKEEPELESGLTAPQDTIRDKMEDFLQSSSGLSSPTPSAAGVKRHGPSRGIPPRHKTQRPTARSDTHQTYSASGPTVPGIPAGPSMLVTPNMPPAMAGFNTGFHGQHSGHLHSFHQLVGLSRDLNDATAIAIALETVFNTAHPGQQKQMLGEVLYPRIERLQPQLAGKLTGMILERDNVQLIHLIANDAALLNMVDQALRVYNDYLKANNVESV
ncbi:hypothetical protein KCU65_g4465, partial [Aureobasidium melanogenum]